VPIVCRTETSSNEIDVRFIQFIKPYFSIVVIELGIFIDVIVLQSANVA